MEHIISDPSSKGHQQPVALRIVGHLASIVFHPLFIPGLVTAFLLFVHPLAFAGFGEKRKVLILVAVFFSTGFLPAFSVFLMQRLGFVQSIFLRTQRERIIPYSAAIIFYFWIWYVFKNQPEMPLFFVKFLLGSFLAVCSGWMLNIRLKVSMHGTAVGGMMMFFLLQILLRQEVTGQYFAIALVIAGLVCTARLLVSDHSVTEVYLGFFVGIACQLVAWWI